MTDRIETLQPADFDELVAHLDEAYGRGPEATFAAKLPPISNDPADRSTHRRYVVRRSGQIVASAGVFSLDVHLADRTLRMAAIGSVSTSPSHRNQGLMSLLMSHLSTLLPEQGYHLSWLVGRRHRYRWFGWEVAGCECQYQLMRHAVDTAWRDRPPVTLKLLPASKHRELLDALARLRREQLFSIEGLPFSQRAHDRTLVAIDAEGQPIGYVLFSPFEPSRRTIVELVGTDVDVELDMIRAAMELIEHDTLALYLPAFPSPLHRKLANDVTAPLLGPSSNWRVFDWQHTLLALLEARHRAHALPPGRVVVEIEGAERLALTMSEAGARVEPTADPADVAAEPVVMTRLLLGHLPPRYTMALPPAAGLLDAWCPLPISMPMNERR